MILIMTTAIICPAVYSAVRTLPHFVTFVFRMRKLKLSKFDLAEPIKLVKEGSGLRNAALVCVYVVLLTFLRV